MIRSNRNIVTPLAASALLLLAVTDAEAGELQVSAETPDVTIETRPAGRNFIRLPDLDYVFTIEAECTVNLEPTSISLSIADTRISLDADQVAAARPVRVSVSVPAAQIGPVAMENQRRRTADLHR